MLVPVSAGKLIVLPAEMFTAAPLLPLVPPARGPKAAVLLVPPVVAPMLALSVAKLPAPQTLANWKVSALRVLV